MKNSQRNNEPPEFSEKSLKSIVVINNPAIKGAISWRLAEYLNAWKAIISVPFKMELPIALAHNQEVFYVNDPSELNFTVQQIVLDDAKKEKLEIAAKAYFETYCTPEKQIAYIY